MRSELESPQDQRCWSVIAQIHRLHLGRSETPPQIKQELKYGHLIEVKRLFSKRSAAILSPQFVQQIDRQRTLVQRLSFSNLHSMSVNRRQRRTKKQKIFTRGKDSVPNSAKRARNYSLPLLAQSVNSKPYNISWPQINGRLLTKPNPRWRPRRNDISRMQAHKPA